MVFAVPKRCCGAALVDCCAVRSSWTSLLRGEVHELPEAFWIQSYCCSPGAL